MVNLHIFPAWNINSTNSNILSGTFKIRSYVNEHYDANECELEGSPWESIWLFFTGRIRCIFLWNVLYISLCRSWCYSSWQLKLSRSPYLHKYFFYKSDIISSCWHPWWELDVLTFQWHVNSWRADRRHQRHAVSRLCHPFPQCGAWTQATKSFSIQV